MVDLLLIFLVAFTLTSVSLPKILIISFRKKLFDKPEARKQHRTPSSRLGGVCFVPVLLFSLSLILSFSHLTGDHVLLGVTENGMSTLCGFVAGLLAIYLVGITDDLIGLGYKRKFLVQFFGALLLVCSGETLNHLGGLFGITAVSFWPGALLTILLVVYITNALNLIDGIDGLASGLCIIALVLLTLFSYQAHDMLHALLATAQLGILLPFWYYNVYGRRNRRLKIFMGDGGSLTIGYVLSFSLLFFLRREPGFDPWANHETITLLAAFILPCFDIVRVMGVRLMAGKSMFLPDRNHIHHKMMRAGCTPLQTLYLLLLLSVAFIALNWILSLCGLTHTWIFLVDVAVWLLFHQLLNIRIRHHEA